MKTRVLLSVLLAGLVGSTTAARPVAPQPEFVLIVNRTNPVTALAASEVGKIFLKKAELWPDGTPTAPVDLSESSPIRASFTREILRRSVPAIKSYWQQEAFSGRDVPPPEEASDDDVIDVVKSIPGAIGYVSPNAQLRGVKTVSVH